MVIENGHKTLIKKFVSLIIAPFGKHRLKLYLFIFSQLEYLIPTRFYRTLLNLPNVDTSAFVLSSIRSSPGSFKYTYATNAADDLRYSCRVSFNDWEYVSRDLFRSLASNSNLVFDIGAYTGIYSIEAAKSNPTCIVYSFEPNIGILGNLRENIQVNKLEERVKVYPRALGTTPREAKLFLSTDQTSSSTASLLGTSSNFFEVSVSTMDLEFLNEAPDLIKIDVEGSEPDVFKGGEKLLNTYKPIILSEALSKAELQKQEDVLLKFGYMTPIQIFAGLGSDSRNFVWFSAKDENRVISALDRSRANFRRNFPDI